MISFLNNIIVCRSLAHYYALNTVMRLIPFTTQKYQKQFSLMPIQQLCFQYGAQLFPNLLSKLYLDDADFGQDKRTSIENVVESIKSSFDQLLDANDWMDPATMKIAKEKLAAIHPNVGAPDIVFDEKKLEQDSAEVSCQCNFRF